MWNQKKLMSHKQRRDWVLPGVREMGEGGQSSNFVTRSVSSGDVRDSIVTIVNDNVYLKVSKSRF